MQQTVFVSRKKKTDSVETRPRKITQVDVVCCGKEIRFSTRLIDMETAPLPRSRLYATVHKSLDHRYESMFKLPPAGTTSIDRLRGFEATT